MYKEQRYNSIISIRCNGSEYVFENPFRGLVEKKIGEKYPFVVGAQTFEFTVSNIFFDKKSQQHLVIVPCRLNQLSSIIHLLDKDRHWQLQATH